MSEPHRGYFVVDEEAMRIIDRSFDKLCDARNASHCYATLCRIANLKGNDTFEVSIASLARDLHCVYRDAQKALALVEVIGLVKIQRRKVPGTKENAPSVYTVIRTRADIMSAPTDNMSEGVGKDRVDDVSRTFPNNSPKNCTNNDPNHSLLSVSRTDNEADEDLDSFWQAYPRKEHKGNAGKAWNALKKKRVLPDVSVIIAALQWQKESYDWTKDEGEFIPLPASYLNGHCWLDEPR